MTSNEEILDAYIRHQMYLMAYAGGVRNSALPYIAGTEPELHDIVVKYTNSAPSRYLTGAEGRAWQSELTQAVMSLRDPAWLEASAVTTEAMKNLAVAEPAFAVAVIDKYMPVIMGLTLPPTQQLLSVVNSQPFEGKILKEWLATTRDRDISDIVSGVKNGIVSGQTPKQITTTIMGTTKAGAARNGSVARKSWTNMESVIRTATNGVAQSVKQDLYAENSDVMDMEQFVATLDSRTTPICAKNDNKIFPIGQGPIPPLHFNCRSLRAPYFGPEIVSKRPFNPTTEKTLLKEYTSANGLDKVASRAQLPYGYKTKFDKFSRGRLDQLVGQVPSDVDYNVFFSRQSEAFQNEWLGIEKANIYRTSGEPLDKFINPQGQLYTNQQLEKKGL